MFACLDGMTYIEIGILKRVVGMGYYLIIIEMVRSLSSITSLLEIHIPPFGVALFAANVK